GIPWNDRMIFSGGCGSAAAASRHECASASMYARWAKYGGTTLSAGTARNADSCLKTSSYVDPVVAPAYCGYIGKSSNRSAPQATRSPTADSRDGRPYRI